MAITPSPSWFCAQIGAREHYAIPRALHAEGKLGGLFTDYWAGAAIRRLPPFHGSLRALTSRYHPDLKNTPVSSCNLRALAWEIRLRRGAREGANRYDGFLDIGQRFATAVRDQWSRRDFAPGALFYAYDTGALEAFAAFRQRGVRCVLNQMDPGRVETDIVREEEGRWPGWALKQANVPEAYFQRREEEWSLADRVVVNSQFSRQAMIRQGVPAEKIAVIPLCYEAGSAPLESRRETRPKQPLRVLFLGQVILRKGIQYLIEAARLLRDESVQISVVGGIGITEKARQSVPPNIKFHGRVGRDQARDWYRQSDLFVLPTLSDGFALTQLEAMAYGLPVIATPNCGDVVTPEADGLIVPPANAEALAQGIARYASDRNWLSSHRVNARLKAGQFTLSRLGANLVALDASL